jgi:hypothetical protein
MLLHSVRLVNRSDWRSASALASTVSRYRARIVLGWRGSRHRRWCRSSTGAPAVGCFRSSRRETPPAGPRGVRPGKIQRVALSQFHRDLVSPGLASPLSSACCAACGEFIAGECCFLTGGVRLDTGQVTGELGDQAGHRDTEHALSPGEQVNDFLS